jgi:hypothetical protein
LNYLIGVAARSPTLMERAQQWDLRP